MMGERWAPRLRLPARASVAYLTAGVVTKAVGIISGAVFTRLISAAEYGEFSLYMTLLALLSGTVTGFCPQGTVYRLYKEGDNVRDITASVLRLELCVLASVYLLLFTFNRLLKLSRLMIFILCLQLLSDVLLGAYLTERRYLYSFGRVLFLLLTPAVCAPCLALLLLRLGLSGALSRALGLAVLSLSVLPPALGLLPRAVASRGQTGRLLKLSLPMLPSTLSVALSAQLDRIVISLLMGKDALGRYSVVHSIALGLSFAVGALGSALFPWLTRRLANRDAKRARELCDELLFLFSAATVFIIALIPEGMLILAPKAYSVALPAALPLAISTLPYFISSVNSSLLGGVRGGGAASAATVTGSLSGVLLALLLIPPLGYYGAGLAALLGSLLSASLSLYLGKRRHGIMLFSPLRSALLLSATLLYGGILSLLYDYAPLRILLLIPPAILAISRLLGVYGALRERTA